MARIIAAVLLAAAFTYATVEAATLSQRRVQRRTGVLAARRAQQIRTFTARRIGDAQPRNETPAPEPNPTPAPEQEAASAPPRRLGRLVPQWNYGFAIPVPARIERPRPSIAAEFLSRVRSKHNRQRLAGTNSGGTKGSLGNSDFSRGVFIVPSIGSGDAGHNRDQGGRPSSPAPSRGSSGSGRR